MEAAIMKNMAVRESAYSVRPEKDMNYAKAVIRRTTASLVPSRTQETEAMTPVEPIYIFGATGGAVNGVGMR